MICSLHEGPDPVPEVGGKGASLQVLASSGFAVPEGFVLTVAFLAPWMEAVRSSEAWGAFVGGDDGATVTLRAFAGGLAPTPEQAAELAKALDRVPGTLFAVRSSAPEEDLEGSSFAGGYETRLGVRREDLPTAIAAVFASCLDARVVAYKRQKGFDAYDPRIAVIVQRQVAAEVAGVAFTADPVDNDYDHAVIHANHGLGESVVSGLATPDQWTVDKVTGRIVARVVGRKEVGIFLAEGGGTEERTPPNEGPCLDDARVAELCRAAVAVERVYGRPMDLEWAVADGSLRLLQARPVTTLLDLPEDLRTAPGARRRLYLDATISAQAWFRPMSVLGTDVLRALLGGGLSLVRPGMLEREDSPIAVGHGRLFVVLSNLFPALDPRWMGARIAENIDPLSGWAIAAADRATYRAPRGTLAHRAGVARMLVLYWSWRVLAALVGPARARARIDALVRSRREAVETADLEALRERQLPDTGRVLFGRILPRFVASRLAKVALRRLLRGADVDAVDRALPGNVTVEMGHALCAIARALPDEVDAEALSAALVDGTAPPALRTAWEDFLQRYGHRGPEEIDAAIPRYGERPKMLIEQAAALRAVPQTEWPDAMHARARAAGDEVLEGLLAEVGPVRRWLARRAAAVMTRLGGLREMPKYVMVLPIDRVRTLALARGEAWVREGRLERAEQVFDLTLADLADPPEDLLVRGRENRAGADRLARYPELPRVFDSRGRILRPPRRETAEGELVGMPVSAGIVRGTARVLHAPDEKPLLPGEILVARATDPGWTPLFANAAAVVLEVGGALQHGALVAREYGRPCVTGIDGATRVIADGSLIEVDGDNGVVRRVS